MAAGYSDGTLLGPAPAPASRPRPPAFLVAPAILIAAAILLPLAYLLLRTLGASEKVPEILFRTHTLEVLVRTVVLVVAVTAVCIALATPLAWLTSRSDLPGRRLWLVLTTLPLVIPSYVGGFIIVSALGPKGLLQQALAAPFGIDRLPEIYGFPGAFLAITLLAYPYVLLTVRAALSRLDPAQEEAARGLGLSPLETFFRVTLPHLRPALAASGLLVALYTLSDFGAVSVLRYETFTWSIYLQYESAFDRTAAAALSVVLVGLAVGFLVFETVTRGAIRYHSVGSAARRPTSITPLGRWKGPAVAFCASVFVIALVLPLAVLGYWLIRGIGSGEILAAMWRPALNSVYAAALATGATVAAAIPVAFLATRFPGRLSRLLERSAYIGFALPGLVVALALVFFAANFATALYQTMTVLVFAYVILFLPTATGAIRSSLLQLNPNLEEAARSLGRRPAGVMTAIILPLIRPGLLAGAALVFLVTIKELPATLILSPLGFETLATSVWSAVSEAFFARAAAPAMLLVLASSVALVFILRQERGQ